MKVFTAFSGYDSQCMALKRVGIDFELVGWSEINKNSITAHNACFPDAEELNYGDISKIDWGSVPDFDLFTYSSPCQDFSLAGLRRGGDKGSGTRSSLLWECEKAIAAKKPSYLVMENVKAIKGAQFAENLKKWKDTLSGLGYFNYEYVLNASDYNIPQNRERYFLVSIRSDKFRMMGTPMTQPMTTTLRDVVEEVVESKYYFDISKRNVEDIIAKIGMDSTAYLGNGQYFTNTCKGGCSRTLRANYRKTGFTDTVLTDSGRMEPGIIEKVSPTLRSGYYKVGFTCGMVSEDGHKEPVVVDVVSPTLMSHYYKTGFKNGVVYENGRSEPVVVDTIAPTLCSQYCDSAYSHIVLYDNGHRAPGVIEDTTIGYAVRKLTERECFRLMDVDDHYIDKMLSCGIARTGLYEMAGNSIPVGMLAALFESFLK